MNVESLVECQFDECKMIFENPITLPGGNSLRSQHLERYNDKFECIFCKHVHNIDENGFFTNSIINQLIAKYLEMDPLRREATSSFNKLNEIINEYEKLDPEGYIFDYIREIINNIDLHREELVKEINEKSDEMIKLLKEKENICKLNAVKYKKINLDEFKTVDLPVWKRLLRKTVLKQNKLN